MSQVTTSDQTGSHSQVPAHADVEFDLNMHTARLLLEEPFFSAISRRVDKRASRAIPTAGVMVNPETAQFEMLYNPEFFRGLTNPERRAVLKHEYYHLIFKHVTDRLPEGVAMKKWNIATDLAINSHIDDLPEGGLIPGHGPFADLPKGESAEWYMNNMPDMPSDGSDRGNSGKSSCSGEDAQGQDDSKGSQSQSNDSGGSSTGNSGDLKPLDDHSGWGKCPQEIKDIAGERIKDIVKQAAEEAASSNSWGSVSSRTRKKILDSLTTKVDWRKVLRYFIKTSQRANRSSSMKRINRRYPYVHAGRKQARIARVAISIDQSGSVDDSMLSLFFAELNKLSELAEFTVVPFDTVVAEDKVYVWKKGTRRAVERVMYGGTNFDAPTEYVNNKSFDGHIILTDMGASKPKTSKCQRMWMTTQYCADRAPFTTRERVVVVDK